MEVAKLDSKVLLISNCRFAFLTWTMSLWLRLKRGLFLKRRRCSSDYSIVYFSYTIIPRFFMLNLPCLSRTCPFFPKFNSCLLLLLSLGDIATFRNQCLPAPLCLYIFQVVVFSSPSSSSTSFHTVLLLSMGSICQLLYHSISRHPPS